MRRLRRDLSLVRRRLSWSRCLMEGQDRENIHAASVEAKGEVKAAVEKAKGKINAMKAKTE